MVMNMDASAKPPADLAKRGRSLWTAIHTQHPAMNDIEREVAYEACRVVDRLEQLDEHCKAEPAVVEGRQGPMTNPAYTEARQQQNLLKMLVASLRIPDETTGKGRVNGNGPARGAYKTGGNNSAVTSIRDRLRSA